MGFEAAHRGIRLLALTGAAVLVAAGALAAGPAAHPAGAAPAVPGAPGVQPGAVDRVADRDSAFHVDATVRTPGVPLESDVVLLLDTTGSMDESIADVQAGLRDVVHDVRATDPDARFAVASYKDIVDGAGLFSVAQDLTDDDSAVQAALDGLWADGGGDDPQEDWLNALGEVSTGAIAFRPGSNRVVVLVGDAPSHDPSNDWRLADTIGVLGAASIRLVAVALATDPDTWLDDAGQVSAIVDTVGGALTDPDTAAVTDAVLAGLHTRDVTVTPRVTSCEAGLTVTVDPELATGAAGSDVAFTETVQVSADAVPGATLHCAVGYMIDGTEMGGAFTHTISIQVAGEAPGAPSATPSSATPSPSPSFAPRAPSSGPSAGPSPGPSPSRPQASPTPRRAVAVQPIHAGTGPLPAPSEAPAGTAAAPPALAVQASAADRTELAEPRAASHPLTATNWLVLVAGAASGIAALLAASFRYRRRT